MCIRYRFRQLFVQLQPQLAGQEVKALKQALDIRIASDLPEKRGQGRATLGETAPQLAQSLTLILLS